MTNNQIDENINQEYRETVMKVYPEINEGLPDWLLLAVKDNLFKTDPRFLNYRAANMKDILTREKISLSLLEVQTVATIVLSMQPSHIASDLQDYLDKKNIIENILATVNELESSVKQRLEKKRKSLMSAGGRMHVSGN